MSKREIFGIKILFTGIILFIITLSILNSCSLFHGSKMSKNKLKKEHHLADGSFKNIYASSINLPSRYYVYLPLDFNVKFIYCT